MLINPKKRRGKNPVTALSKGLEEDLRRQGYASGTIWKHRKLLNELSGWLQGQQLAMGDLSMAQVERFMVTAVPPACANSRRAKHWAQSSVICVGAGWRLRPNPPARTAPPGKS